MELLIGLTVPMAGTALGAALVFLIRDRISHAFDTWAKLALLPHGGAQRDTVKKTPVGGNGQ